MIGEMIQKKRKAAGLSQEQLAAAVGVSRQAVSKWESGAAAPSLENLLELGKALQIPVSELLGEENSEGALEGLLLRSAKAQTRQHRGAVLMALVLAGTLAFGVYLYGRVDSLERQLQRLSGELAAVQSGQQVQPSAGGAENALLSDWEWHIIDYDRQSDTFLLGMRAVPRVAHSGASMRFEVSGADGGVLSAEAAPVGGGFEAQIAVSGRQLEQDPVSLTAFLTDGGATESQLLERVDHLAGYERLRLSGSFVEQPVYHGGTYSAGVEAAIRTGTGVGDESQTLCWPVKGSVQLLAGEERLAEELLEITPPPLQTNEEDASEAWAGECAYYTYFHGVEVPQEKREDLSIWIRIEDNFGRVYEYTLPGEER